MSLVWYKIRKVYLQKKSLRSFQNIQKRESTVVESDIYHIIYKYYTKNKLNPLKLIVGPNKKYEISPIHFSPGHQQEEDEFTTEVMWTERTSFVAVQ